MKALRSGAALIGALCAGWPPCAALAQIQPHRIPAPPATLARPAPGAPHPAQLTPAPFAPPLLPSMVSVPTLSYRGNALPASFSTPTLAYAGVALPAQFGTPTLQYAGQPIPDRMTTPELHYIGAARPVLQRIPLGHPPNPN
jgi:hypothetical protein